ncbi:MAG: hypothetical protein SGARI_000787, partial [Bacillariaceae sp.]
MGGFQSKYNATNFETAKGGLTQTILATQSPLSTTESFSIRKQSAMNKREFTVSDSTQNKLYSTRVVPGTAYWFDLLDKKGKPIICVARTHMLNITWDLFSIDVPVWEGQECDEKIASKCKDDNAKLYRLGQFKFSAMGQNHGQFYLYQSSDGGKDKRGVLDTSTSLLQVEKILSMKQKFQTMTPESTSSLIGYWDWSGAAMQLQLAAGTDIALHSVAAVITHMIVMQQAAGGAGAGAGTGAF